MTRKPTCPYCGKHATRAYGRHIWEHLPRLANKHIWLCRPCWAYVGCHGNTWKPLGTLADAETRAERQKTHAAFDPLWQSGRISRNEAYYLLSKELGIPQKDCHIAMMTAEQCRAVRQLIPNLVCRLPGR